MQEGLAEAGGCAGLIRPRHADHRERESCRGAESRSEGWVQGGQLGAGGSQGGQRQGPGGVGRGAGGSRVRPRAAEAIRPLRRALTDPADKGLRPGSIKASSKSFWAGNRGPGLVGGPGHRSLHFFMSRPSAHVRETVCAHACLLTLIARSSLWGEPLQSRCHPVVKALQLGVTKAALILCFGLGNVGVRAQSSRKL